MTTALASLFYRQGGELLAVPGIFCALFIDSVASLLAAKDEFPQLLSWHYYDVLFYSALLYGLSWAYTGLREERQNAIKAKGEI